MKGVIFKRHEVVYYALGLRGDARGETMVSVLNGVNPTKRVLTMRSKGVIYVERIGQAMPHRDEDIKALRKRAEARALELNAIED